MNYEIVTAGSPSELNRKVQSCISEGWKPVGGHQVVTLHSQNKFSGTQHMSTQHSVEYSQTMVKE
jgi:hypothetical protein